MQAIVATPSGLTQLPQSETMLNIDIFYKEASPKSNNVPILIFREIGECNNLKIREVSKTKRLKYDVYNDESEGYYN